MASATKLGFQFINAFLQHENTAPVFLRHTGIQGAIRVLNPSGTGVDKIKIVLKGTIENSITCGCFSNSYPHHLLIDEKIFKLTDVQDSRSSRYSPDHGEGELFQFDFPLAPEPWNSHHEGVSRIPRILPSSMSVAGSWCKAPDGQPCCHAESRVKYEIQAVAHRGDAIVASALREVRVYDTEDQFPPPIHTADFPGEYACAQEKRLKRFMSHGRRLNISVSEPKPLVIHQDQKGTLAAFPIRLSVRHDSKRPNVSAPGPLDVRINSVLKLTTCIALSTMKSHPTLRICQTSPMLATISRNGRPYHRKLRLQNAAWKREAADAQREWGQDVVVWLPIISELASPTPSFFTPLLTRRYSVVMRMDVKSGEGSAVFHLNVPLQIVYASEAPTYTEHENRLDSSQSEPVERLPLYIQ